MNHFKSVFVLLFLTVAAPAMAQSDSTSVVKEIVSDTIAEKEYYLSDELDKQPEFPGGEPGLMQHIKKNLKYPSRAASRGIQGVAEVSFFVEKDGSLTNIGPNNGCDYYLMKEAIRVVKLMPKWTPGEKNGSPVRVKYILPCTFRFQ